MASKKAVHRCDTSCGSAAVPAAPSVPGPAASPQPLLVAGSFLPGGNGPPGGASSISRSHRAGVPATSPEALGGERAEQRGCAAAQGDVPVPSGQRRASSPGRGQRTERWGKAPVSGEKRAMSSRSCPAWGAEQPPSLKRGEGKVVEEGLGVALNRLPAVPKRDTSSSRKRRLPWMGLQGEETRNVAGAAGHAGLEKREGEMPGL